MIKNDIRRVIQSGNGGLVISLPVDYCREHGIVAGMALRLTECAEGLLITKVVPPETTDRSATKRAECIASMALDIALATRHDLESVAGIDDEIDDREDILAKVE
jgi:predicted DNA-binding helix-hairpin-helix protein